MKTLKKGKVEKKKKRTEHKTQSCSWNQKRIGALLAS